MTSPAMDVSAKNPSTSGRFRQSTPLLPPKSGESVRQYLEGLIENFHEADKPDDQPPKDASSRCGGSGGGDGGSGGGSGGKTISQDAMIQQRIRQFLNNDDVSPNTEPKTSARVASVLNASRTAEVTTDRSKSSAQGSSELTISQLIKKDIGTVMNCLQLDDAAATQRDRQKYGQASTSSTLLAPTSKTHPSIVVRQSRSDGHVASSAALSGSEKTTGGHSSYKVC